MMQRSVAVNDPEEITLVESYRVLSLEQREVVLDMAIATAKDRIQNSKAKLSIVPITKGRSAKGIQAITLDEKKILENYRSMDELNKAMFSDLGKHVAKRSAVSCTSLQLVKGGRQP